MIRDNKYAAPRNHLPQCSSIQYDDVAPPQTAVNTFDPFAARGFQGLDDNVGTVRRFPTSGRKLFKANDDAPQF